MGRSSLRECGVRARCIGLRKIPFGIGRVASSERAVIPVARDDTRPEFRASSRFNRHVVHGFILWNAH